MGICFHLFRLQTVLHRTFISSSPRIYAIIYVRMTCGLCHRYSHLKFWYFGIRILTLTRLSVRGNSPCCLAQILFYTGNDVFIFSTRGCTSNCGQWFVFVASTTFTANHELFDFFGRLCLLCIFSQNAGCIFTSGDGSGCCCSCCCFRGHSLQLTAPCHPLCPFWYWQYLLKLSGGKGYLILGVWAEHKLPHFSTLEEGSGSFWCFK